MSFARGQFNNTLPSRYSPAATSGTVPGFYAWTIEHGEQTAKLEPHVKDIPGTPPFYLDTSTHNVYAARFMQSGYFAPRFPAAVSRYYKRCEADFNAG